jgi:membrane fusion protein, multidrug efflux system
MQKLSKLFISIVVVVSAAVASTGFSVNTGFAKGNESNKYVKKIDPVLVDAGFAENKVVPDVLTAVGHVNAYKEATLSFGAKGLISNINLKDGAKVNKGDIIAQLDDKVAKYTLEGVEGKLKYDQSNYDSYLELYKKTGNVSKNTLINFESLMLQSKSIVDQDKVNLALTKLKAPFDGFIGIYQKHEGDYVAEADSIVGLQKINPVKIRYSFPSSDMTKVSLAQPVNITSSAIPNKVFKGYVTYRAQSIDKDTGTQNMQAEVKNTSFELLPGMFVNVTQVINPNRVLLVVPSMSLQTDISGTFIYILEDRHLVDGKIHGIAKKRKVTSEVLGADIVVITKGLKNGDMLISTGQQKIHDGSEVVIANTQEIQKHLLDLRHKEALSKIKKIKNKK